MLLIANVTESYDTIKGYICYNDVLVWWQLR